MRRTTPLLPLCVLAMAMFATLAQEPHGQGGGSASPAPVAPADQAPPAPEAPAPAASTPPAENQKLTGTVIATPANAIVIRNEGGVDITFLVESTSVLPRSMSVGEMATVVYRGTEGGQPVALMITLFPAPQPAEPRTSTSAAGATPAGRPAAGESESGPPSQTASGDSAGAAPKESQVAGAADTRPPTISSTSKSEKAASPVPDNALSSVEKAPVLPEETTSSTSGTPPQSAAPDAGAATTDETSTQPDSPWGTNRNLLPVAVIGGMVVLGVLIGVWSYARMADRASSTVLRIK
jgi:hypothetical protein